MRIKQTNTVALLELSPAAYEEISNKLKAAGYDNAFNETDGVRFIDMSGIGVTTQEPDPVAGHFPLKTVGRSDICYYVNGAVRYSARPFELTYGEVLEMAGEDPNRVLTVIWHNPVGRGTLPPGKSMVITDGTIINVADTSNA